MPPLTTARQANPPSVAAPAQQATPYPSSGNVAQFESGHGPAAAASVPASWPASPTPASMTTTLVAPHATGTGVRAWITVPLPSCPASLSPQHQNLTVRDGAGVTELRPDVWNAGRSVGCAARSAAGHGRDLRETVDQDRCRRAGSRAIPELPIAVISPARKRAARRHDCAAGLRAGRKQARVWQAPNRSPKVVLGFGSRAADAQRALRVIAEAHHAVAEIVVATLVWRERHTNMLTGSDD